MEACYSELVFMNKFKPFLGCTMKAASRDKEHLLSVAVVFHLANKVGSLKLPFTVFPQLVSSLE